MKRRERPIGESSPFASREEALAHRKQRDAAERERRRREVNGRRPLTIPVLGILNVGDPP